MLSRITFPCQPLAWHTFLLRLSGSTTLDRWLVGAQRHTMALIRCNISNGCLLALGERCWFGTLISCGWLGTGCTFFLAFSYGAIWAGQDGRYAHMDANFHWMYSRYTNGYAAANQMIRSQASFFRCYGCFCFDIIVEEVRLWAYYWAVSIPS